MPLSSNTVTHFTQDKESLFGILADNFQINYCLERYKLGNKELAAEIPMISFCDIPLSQIKDHIEKYGKYGIGLSKEWATRMGLNPVLYIEQQSHLANNLCSAMETFLGSYGPNGKLTNSQTYLVDVLRYIKNYQGDLQRKNKKTIKNYRFSDEREWRYSPPHSDTYEMIVPRKEYESDKENYDASIKDLRLRFEPNDIKYIFIKEDSEITDFVDILRRTKGKTYSHQDVERLMTRLLTTEQIMNDI